jgi:hypothetical protein
MKWGWPKALTGYETGTPWFKQPTAIKILRKKTFLSRKLTSKSLPQKAKIEKSIPKCLTSSKSVPFALVSFPNVGEGQAGPVFVCGTSSSTPFASLKDKVLQQNLSQMSIVKFFVAYNVI